MRQQLHEEGFGQKRDFGKRGISAERREIDRLQGGTQGGLMQEEGFGQKRDFDRKEGDR